MSIKIENIIFQTVYNYVNLGEVNSEAFTGHAPLSDELAQGFMLAVLILGLYVKSSLVITRSFGLAGLPLYNRNVVERTANQRNTKQK